MIKNIISQVAALLLVLLFTYTAFSKLADFQQFQFDMQRQPLPNWGIAILIWILPLIEVVTAILLVLTRTRHLGFYIGFLLMLLFTGYVGLGLTGVFGEIPCSCGGIFKEMTWTAHLMLNVVFVLVAVIGIICSGRPSAKADGNG